jgi:hypothetical protein
MNTSPNNSANQTGSFFTQTVSSNFSNTLPMTTSIITSARQLFAIALTIIGIFFSQNTQAIESICKRTMCGQTYNSGDANPKFLTGETQTIRVFVKYGDLVSSATTGVGGIAATIGAKGGGGNINSCLTYVDVNIAVPSSAIEQNNITVSLFGNLPFIGNTLTCTFRIDVRKKAVVSGITIKENNVNVTQLIAGRTYQMTVTGTDINDLRVDDSKIESASLANGGTGSSQMFYTVFKATTQTTVTGIRFEEIETPCHHDITKTITSLTLYPKPDLAPYVLSINRYVLTGNESCGGSLGKVTNGGSSGVLTAIKNSIGAPSATEAVKIKEITWPDVQFGVTNTGGPITGTFKVQLKNGNTVLKEETVTNLAAGEEKIFSYTRPKSKKKLMRMAGCNNGNDVHAHQDNATNPEYNWADPAQFTVKVDALNNIEEGNETNNQNNY